jgi:Bacterial PH domain
VSRRRGVRVQNTVANTLCAAPWAAAALAMVWVLVQITLDLAGLVDAADRPWRTRSTGVLVRCYALSVVCLVVFAAFAWRSATRGVATTPDGLVVRRFFRRQRLAWSGVSGFHEVGSSNKPDEGRWYGVAVDLRDRTSIELPLRSGRVSTRDRLLADLNRLLAATRVPAASTSADPAPR